MSRESIILQQVRAQITKILDELEYGKAPKLPPVSEFEKAWREYTDNCLPGAYPEYTYILAKAIWQACRDRFFQRYRERQIPSKIVYIGDKAFVPLEDLGAIAAELDANKPNA